MFNIKTILYFGILAVFVFVVVNLLIPGGFIQGLFFVGIFTFISYWFSDKFVLWSYGAREVGPGEAPRLYRIVRSVARKAELPVPKIFMIDSTCPNAFATGRNKYHAVVAVTHGLLNLLNDEELEGVIGHELAHIKNMDILLNCAVATLAGIIFYFMRVIQFSFLFGGYRSDDEHGSNPLLTLVILAIAGVAATIIKLAISRQREFLADRVAAKITGKPRGLANALQKLTHGVSLAPMEKGASASAHLFIVNPFKASRLNNLFSTHPPLKERIKRLRAMH
jgi:heat shock protein HtpX